MRNRPNLRARAMTNVETRTEVWFVLVGGSKRVLIAQFDDAKYGSDSASVLRPMLSQAGEADNKAHEA